METRANETAAAERMTTFAKHAQEGDRRWWLGSLAVIKATAGQTGGQFTLVEVLENEGEAPLHVHHREDESFWVIEGEIEFEVGGDAIAAGPGSFLFGPRDVPHRYTVKKKVRLGCCSCLRQVALKSS